MLDARPSREYHLVAMAEQLTELQQVILEIDALDLTVRDSIRQVSARVGFFVGQQRYQEELAKARAIAEQDADSVAAPSETDRE
jgi:hypothetical protein